MRQAQKSSEPECKRNLSLAGFLVLYYNWLLHYILERVSFGRTGERGISVFCFEGEVILTTNSVTTCSIPQRLSSA